MGEYPKNFAFSFTISIEVDKEGNPLPEAQKENPVYFTGGIIEEDGIEETLSPLKVIDKVYYSAAKDYDRTFALLGSWLLKSMSKARLFDVEPLNGVKICASAKVLTEMDS